LRYLFVRCTAASWIIAPPAICNPCSGDKNYSRWCSYFAFVIVWSVLQLDLQATNEAQADPLSSGNGSRHSGELFGFVERDVVLDLCGLL
jgi:hypothetical protein